MNKKVLVSVVALACACCLGLAACGAGGSASSAASSSAASSAASSKASSTASAASSSSASASTAALDPAFKDYADRYMAVCNEVIAVANKAKEAGDFNAVKDEWETVSNKLGSFTDEQIAWAQKYNDGTLTQAEKDYYDKVLIPVATKAANAASSMIDLIKK